jgi:hypothetical protein
LNVNCSRVLNMGMSVQSHARLTQTKLCYLSIYNLLNELQKY